MIKSRHMYFVIATMALGYVGDAVAAMAPRLETNPAPNGKLARKYNVDDYVGCVACLQYDESTFEGAGAFTDYLAGELSDYSAGNLGCNTSFDSIEVYSWGTSSRPDDAGVYYHCNSSGWTQQKLSSVPDGTYDYNNGTITNGKNCERITENGQYYSCQSCTSTLCNDGYYGSPTGCTIKENDCTRCPDSSYKKAIGGSGNFTCTTILQAGQSTAGPNRTISGCKIPQLAGSSSAYCNDNGFFIWDSACSYAG